LEEEWEAIIPECDDYQRVMREHACEHAIANRNAREEFGREWERLVSTYNAARIAKQENQEDRKNEWETLKIVTCLLHHIHSSVTTSIETGGPCPTIDDDPDGVRLAIEDCHIVTRGCDEDSMTHHLCLDWCEIPEVPPLPPVEEPACSPEYIAFEQAQFLAAIQTSYTTMLTAVDTQYPDDPLVNYETILSPAGWAGCAPPLVCVDCAGMAPTPANPLYTSEARTCHVHEEYLSPGQSNSDSFRCLDGTCTDRQGRCNGANNCADASDEMGCDADVDHFVPAYLSRSSACPADMHADVHFQCANSQCIEKVGLCNGIDNCGDGSDEAHCSGAIQVTIEATSGRSVTVETLQSHTGVFHDREYNFDSLGHFAGKTFIKYSNDDKYTDHDHVMTKIRSVEPLTVFVLKLSEHSLPWLPASGFSPDARAGVTFSGVRETRHKEWDPSLLTTDHFSATNVWSKTFEAGTISLPGNQGGDGSFLIFLDRPSPEDDMSHMMIQGCLNNEREFENQEGADVRCCSLDGTSCNSGYFPQTFTFLDGSTSQGTPCQAGQCNGVADTWCHAGVSFSEAKQICAANHERLCTRVEIEDGVCCGTGCSHNAHLIWFDDEQLPSPLTNFGQAGGGNTCVTGDVSEDDCLAAAQGLLASGQTQGRTTLVAGSWGWVPPGCSVQTHFTHGQNGDFAAHYNRMNGANDGGYTKVCHSECQHLHNQDVVAGTFEHYGLDYGNSPSDEECSQTCTANPECTAWVRQPSTGNCWISRQAVVTFEADSDRTTGLRCNH
jgi:hypothetical protein